MKKSRIRYLILLILSLIFVYNFPGIVSAIFLYILLCIPLFSLLYIIVIYSTFKITQSIDSRQIIKGDQVNYTCSIHNETILPYSKISIKLAGEKLLFKNQIESYSFILLPKENYSIKLNLKCKYRGVYNIGIDYIQITDFFNLFNLRFHSLDNKMVVVYPRILAFKNLFINKKGQSENTRKKTEKQSNDQDLSEIREYEYGDRMSLIHWKASAKYNEWMTRQTESVRDEKFIFLVDLQKNNLDYEKNIILEDKFIEILVAVSNLVLSKDISVDMYYEEYTIKKQEYTSYAQFKNFYDFSSKAVFRETKPFINLIKKVTDSKKLLGNNKNKLFIFTSNITYELLDYLSTLQLRQISIILIYISKKELLEEEYETFINKEENLLQTKVSKRITIYKFNIEDDIVNHMEGEVF